MKIRKSNNFQYFILLLGHFKIILLVCISFLDSLMLFGRVGKLDMLPNNFFTICLDYHLEFRYSFSSGICLKSAVASFMISAYVKFSAS